MANEITTMQSFRTTLQAMEPQFKRALPKSISPEKFLRVAETAVATNPNLLNADRTSLYAACTKAAQDGLLPDGREGALVEFSSKNQDGTYSKKVQWMPMVMGLVKLARNSGEIKNIVAEVVYANDAFTFRIGIDETPLHQPNWFDADRGAAIGAWAMITLENGEKIVKILPKVKIMKIAGKSKNADQYNPEKGAYFDEWWIKTAIKNVLKYAPRSTELDRVIKLENEEEFQEDYSLETGAEVPEPQVQTEAPAAAKTSSRLSAIKSKVAQAKAEPQKAQEAEIVEDADMPEFDEDRI